jgi:1-acyl-sn-glycerol-3-phosphate acyltransferase
VAGRIWQLGYGATAWALMGMAGVPCWALVLLLPKLSWRWGVTRAALKVLGLGLHITIRTDGDLPPPGQPCVIVANHGSILDSFVLLSVFREPVAFVAGGVFARQRVTGPFLRRLGCAFVRMEALRRDAIRASLEALADLARSGQRLVIFPEGGLVAGPELGRFQLGAFVVAGAARCPVSPLAIVGARAVLPRGARLPRHGHVLVRVGDPLPARGSEWAAAHQLADEARQAIENMLERPRPLPRRSVNGRQVG